MTSTRDFTQARQPASSSERAELDRLRSEVAEWRRREALRTTWARRPDLLAGRAWTAQERRWLAEFQAAEDREEQING